MKAHNSLAGMSWDSVNWSATDTEIARSLGCSGQTVGQYRRIHAPRPPKETTPWETVTGWSEKSNAAIAAELGVPRARVMRHRWKHKLPHGPRSPGSGLHRRNGHAAKPLTLRARVKRLEAVWAHLWPDDPMNLRRRDEVEEIQTRLKSH